MSVVDHVCIVTLMCLHSCSYLDGAGEPGAEGVEDGEALIQPESVSVLAEEVDQLAAFLLQLSPAFTQRAQR